jgi:hypothetical protein
MSYLMSLYRCHFLDNRDRITAHEEIMPVRWAMLSIVPMRCSMKGHITTWWRFGPVIAGCIAPGEITMRNSTLDDSLVDLAAIRNR